MNHVPAVAIAVVLAASLDWLVREPPDRFHPVAWFGSVVAHVDRPWSRPVAVGVIAALALPVAAATTVGVVVLVADTVHPLAGVATAALALFVATSLRSLLEASSTVVTAAGTDIAAARERLPALVGRDPSGLDADLVRSAAVESAAENLVDGLIAPLLAFIALAPVSLALGAAAAAWVKAVNTMDSMLGYPDVAVGTGAARLDDLVMWVPARLGAVLLSLVARSPDPVLAARRWADSTASPNAGWPMGTLASALDIRLEKPGVYELNPFASLPDEAAARDGLRLVGRTGLLAWTVAAAVGVVAWT